MSNAPNNSSSPESPAIRRFGRYWLLRLLARGGMGEVFLAATTGIEGAERPCIIKFIRQDHAKDSSFYARFLDEARVLSQLHHPGVVQVFEAARDANGMPFVAAEFVEGRSLAELRTRALRTAFRLTWADAVAVATATAEALAYVHERKDERGQPLGIVHRDMSPENIMIGYAGDVKLIDFGTALGENRKSHTIAGVVYAKPGYVAPEVANGHTGDARVDLYALGVMLWEMVAGRRFIQGDPAEHLSAVARNDRDLPRIARRVGAPEELDRVIGRLTAFSLADRYESARHALRDLARVLSEAPSLANGERGLRSRIAHLMNSLYPAEPATTRREFSQLLSQARAMADGAISTSTASAIAPASPSPTAHEAANGSLPGTQYELGRLLGRGSAGEVYEAEHIGLGRRVALKVLAPEHASSPEYINRFRREARALSRLSHPNLVTLHDFGQAADGRLFYAMELLEGENLEQKMSREGPLPWKQVLQIARQASEALGCAHEVGLIHRDLKPSNLFLTSTGQVKLLDFGVVRSLDDAAVDAHGLEKMTLFGTPDYMAPEQRKSGAVDQRADLYALGSVMYEMCTGATPFHGMSTVALLDAKMRMEPTGVRQRCPRCDVPRSVERLIMKALRREPRRRFASSAEMTSAIDAAQGRRTARKSLPLSMPMVATALAVIATVAVGSAAAGAWMPSWGMFEQSNAPQNSRRAPERFSHPADVSQGQAATLAAKLIRDGDLAGAEKVLHSINAAPKRADSLAQTP